MSYAPYPAYKDSGVPWLGQVPEEWEVKRVRNMADVLSSNVDKKTIDGEIPVRLCNYVDVYYHDKITDQINFMTATATPSEIERFSLRSGDVVITKDSESADDIGVPALITDQAGDIVCGYHLAIFRGDPKYVHGPHLFYAIKSEPSARQFEVSANGVTRFGLPYGALKSLALALPPIKEQTAIADFLDKKTAEIDGLIAKKEELLRLLAEQRTALITHAVTKGLNPGAPMKPSSIDWLGDVPEGWEIIPLKRDLRFLTSGSRGWAKHYADDGALFLRIGNLNRTNSDLRLDDKQFVDVPDGAEGERTKVQEGDLLFSITAYLGSVGVVPLGIGEAYVSQHVALARLFQRRFIPDWVALVTLSTVGKAYLSSLGYGGTKIQLALDDIGGLPVPCPPIEKQKDICEKLSQETQKLDESRKRILKAIAHLREYRTALITNAVTGKIKVA